MNTIFSAEERKKIVVVFSGTDNKAFLQFLTDELHARGCKVDVYRELWDALRCLQNPAVVGFIVDDYNEVEIHGVREAMTVLARIRSKLNVVVLKPSHGAADLLSFRDAYIWVHNPDDFIDAAQDSLTEYFDHLAFGTHFEQPVYAHAV